MTNNQIIADIAASIYGVAAVKEMIERETEIPLHTAAGWKARGPYRIKKGESGIETRLWKVRKDKAEAFYMAKAYLFREDQVEFITE